MPTFEYSAIGHDGVAASGHAISESELTLDGELEQRGLVLTHARVSRASARSRRGRLSTQDLIHVTHQLSTVTSAGVRIVEGLSSIGQRLENRSSRAVIERIVAGLRRGQSLSEALEQEPDSFPAVFRASVRAGEASGAADRVLLRLSRHMSWARGIRATTLQALIYPAILFAALSGLVLVLLYFVLPRLIGLFPGGRDSLPMQTRIVMGLSDFLREHALLLGGGALLLVVVSLRALAAPGGRLAFHSLLLRLPQMGRLMRQLATSKFASTASILQNAGCDVFTMLEVSAKTCGNAAMEQAFGRVAAGVRRGQTIAQGLEREAHVDPLLVQMVAVGESTGELDRALERLVEYYDEEIPRTVKRFLAILEPALLLCAGAVVAFILLAAILPIFSLYGSLG